MDNKNEKQFCRTAELPSLRTFSITGKTSFQMTFRAVPAQFDISIRSVTLILRIGVVMK